MGKQLTRFVCKMAIKIQIVRHFIWEYYVYFITLSAVFIGAVVYIVCYQS